MSCSPSAWGAVPCESSIDRIQVLSSASRGRRSSEPEGVGSDTTCAIPPRRRRADTAVERAARGASDALQHVLDLMHVLGLGLELEVAAQGRARALAIAPVAKREAERAVRGGVVRIELDRVAVIVDRLVQRMGLVAPLGQTPVRDVGLRDLG